MAQPTLDQRFKKGPPTRAENESHGWMTSNERRFILWGIKEGWSAARIARGLGVNEATVRRFRTKFAKDPDLIYQLGTYEIYGRARHNEYRCLVCADQVLGRGEIERHVLRHFLSESKVEELMPSEAQTPTESPLTAEAPSVAAVQDNAEDSRAVASASESAADGSHIAAASPLAPDQPDEFERLVEQIGADERFEDALKRALNEVSLRRGQPVQGTPPTPDVEIPQETSETSRQESLMQTQPQGRSEAHLHEAEATEAGDESRQDENAETSEAALEDAGRAIPLPPSSHADVESLASAPLDTAHSQTPMDELPEEELQREGADSQEAPTGRREPTERVMEQDQGATETEMMRLAFERLKSRAAERPGGTAGRRSTI